MARPAPGRGQTELLGAILVFALAVGVVASLQVFAVPLADKKVEYSHSLAAQGDVSAVSTAVFHAATTGVENVVTFDYGTTYPSRSFLRNPPPASGTLSSEDLGTVTLAHVSADDQANDYASDRTYAFQTAGLVYHPNYNEYGGAPATHYEYPVAYNAFPNGNNSVLGEHALVRGDHITLALVSANFSRSQVAAGAVHVVPVSAPAQATTVTNAGGQPLTLRLPTHLDKATWESVLHDQLAVNGGRITSLDVEPGSGSAPNTLVLTFQKDETYQLRLARVAVDYAPQQSPDAAYLVETSGDHSVLGAGGQQRVVVQARDKYDNPVSGARVSVPATDLGGGKGTVTNGQSTGDQRTAYTGQDGRATFHYTAPQSGLTGVSHANFTVSLDGVNGAAGDVPFSMELRGSTIVDVTEPGSNENLSAVRLSATADDVNDPSGLTSSAQQLTLHDYQFTSVAGVSDVSVVVRHASNPSSNGNGNPQEVASRDHIAASGNETLRFDSPGHSSDTQNLRGNKQLRVTVTATDNAGATLTCSGVIGDGNERITLNSANGSGRAFSCSLSGGNGTRTHGKGQTK